MIKNKAFLWGSASAAYQIEGACKADGKGISIWDQWSHISGKTFEGTNGDRATDHYEKFEEDVALMKAQGLKAYRFSIAWTRILPNGVGAVNEAGIAFYRRLIEALRQAGIEPLVTLYHWDLPLVLQEQYGGWESRQIVEDFDYYAKKCFEYFGDVVRYWIVMNEPNIFTHQGYMLGIHPPGIQNEATYLKTYHHTALAHAKAVLSFKEMGLEGMVGSSIAFMPAYAASNAHDDLVALERYYDTNNWWFMDIYFKGIYPAEAILYYQSKGIMPEVTSVDSALLKAGAAAYDFIGINYYQTAMIAHNPVDGVGLGKMNTTGKKGSQQESGVPGLYKMVKNPNLTYTDWDWAIDPEGLLYGMRELKKRYGKPVLISENGLGAFDKIDSLGEINDDYRIEFLKAHVEMCEKAVEEGIELLAYCTWSFTDLLSWLNGFQKRYGFVYVDFEDEQRKRIPKKSYYWYRDLIANNGL